VRLVTDASIEDEGHEAPPKNIIRLPVITTLNLDPDAVMQEAMGKLECVVVVGYEMGEDGREYFASSIADAGTNAWLLQRAIWLLNKQVDEMSQESED